MVMQTLTDEQICERADRIAASASVHAWAARSRRDFDAARTFFAVQALLVLLALSGLEFDGEGPELLGELSLDLINTLRQKLLKRRPDDPSIDLFLDRLAQQFAASVGEFKARKGS